MKPVANIAPDFEPELHVARPDAVSSSIQINAPASLAQQARTKKKPPPQKPHTCPDGRMNEAAAADYIGKKPATLRSWRCQGRGPSYTKAGGVWYWKDDLDVWIGRGIVDHDA